MLLIGNIVEDGAMDEFVEAPGAHRNVSQVHPGRLSLPDGKEYVSFAFPNVGILATLQD